MVAEHDDYYCLYTGRRSGASRYSEQDLMRWVFANRKRVNVPFCTKGAIVSASGHSLCA